MNRRLLSIAIFSATLLATGCAKKQPSSSDLYNDAARLDASLPYPVLQWKPLATMTDRSAGTTSTLFGNAAAVAAARSGQSYPAGAILALAAWQQREDPHWFGAKIPGNPSQVEFVEVTASGMKYRLFAGSPMTEQSSAPDRAAAIVALKAIVLP